MSKIKNIFKKVYHFFNPVDYNSFDSLKKYCINSGKLEWVLEAYEYQKDTKPRDNWKLPEQFIKDGGGDCEDFAIMAHLILQGHGYDTKIYVVWNKEIGHAICWFRKDRDEGIFSNYQRTLYKNFDIVNDYIKNTEYTKYREVKDWKSERRV